MVEEKTKQFLGFKCNPYLGDPKKKKNNKLECFKYRCWTENCLFYCRIGFEIPITAALLLKINDTYESVFYPNKIILML